jgi:hypothetical protein
MPDSLRTLLAGILDYAGLFPPAQLPLEQAVRNYAQYRQGSDRWMLGRFICPAARLADLAALGPTVQASDPPWPLSALGRGGASRADFTHGLDADLRDRAAFAQAHSGLATVDVLELRLPADADAALVDETVARLATLPPGVAGYLELAPSPDWETRASAFIAALGRRRASRPLGFKLRCGGLDASAFPSAERIAFVLQLCAEHAVPLKATAGLHHPLPRFNPALKATMHGFVNLFAAGVFRSLGPLEDATLVRLLRDDQPDHFSFGDSLRWGDLSATADQVARARQTAVVSFGSCSFDEPRDDLRALVTLAGVR